MKKSIRLILPVIAAALALGSCSQQTAANDANADALINSIVSDINGTQAQAQKPVTENVTTTAASADNAQTEDFSAYTESPVNIDLTTMNSTMVYSVIYDIMTNTDHYFGKTILLDGFFDTSYDESLDTRYYFIVIPDATACCAQGLEFKLDDSLVYPDDYPEVRDDIRVRGKLAQYEELGQTYFRIEADSMTRI